MANGMVIDLYSEDDIQLLMIRLYRFSLMYHYINYANRHKFLLMVNFKR